ncbi:hypothetical protein P43SY_005013 [Pythium insidiosum]|uniref:Calcyclin-binding protein n=1 Tax=Pythium insidiosum TaxID=114742 RepID=A0AAD5QC01_PYTIN|nr:hypothetical protein P43SY_005013 [Pythium insidiosum]
MAGNENDALLAREVAELERLLAQVQCDGNRRDLTQLLTTKQQLLRASQANAVAADEPEPMTVDSTEPPTPTLPKPTPVKVGAHPAKPSDVGEDVHVYTEISRFGWEDEGYGKDKVMVHIMSGIDGVGDLPKENVSCHFTKDSFDLKILGLGGKNYRLVKHHLDKEINPSKSSFRVKKNRIAITLWKEDNHNTWMNLTAKNPNKPRGANSKDPAAGIMDMMKEMYDEGDDEMKRTIAKAWSESREKQAAGGAL